MLQHIARDEYDSALEPGEAEMQTTMGKGSTSIVVENAALAFCVNLRVLAVILGFAMLGAVPSDDDACSIFDATQIVVDVAADGDGDVAADGDGGAAADGDVAAAA